MSTTADYLDLKAEFIAGFPEGTGDFVDWFDPDGPGPLLEAMGHVLEDAGTSMVDALRLELSPLTCSLPGIAVWERTLGLLNTRIARVGQDVQRRAQVLSRLREYGPPNVQLIQTVLEGFLVYADQTTIPVLESDRMGVRLGNQKSWNGPVLTFPPTATIQFVVWDDPYVSPAGAQVDLQLTCAEMENLSVTLTDPNGLSYHWPDPLRPVDTRIGEGPLVPDVGMCLRLYAKFFAGDRHIYGTWTLALTSTNVNDKVWSATLLVEGLGRYFDWRGQPADGLGAAMYECGVISRPPLLGPGFDLDGALLAVQRLAYARSRGSLIRQPKLPGPPPMFHVAIPDDDNTLPDGCVPGAG